jgi:hypothetical protein
MVTNLSWMKKAIQEGRICPECKQPVSKTQWQIMTGNGRSLPCNTCRMAHWEGKIGSGGSSRRDNDDREALDRMRGF